MDQLIPLSPEEFQGVFQAISPLKSSFLKESDTYAFSAHIINPNYVVDGQRPVTYSEATKFSPSPMTIKCNGGTDIAIAGIYNNSPSVKTLDTRITSNLGENDCLIILQFNDMMPGVNQVLFVKSQEMHLSERINLKLNQYDGIVIILGKTRVNDTMHSLVKITFDEQCNAVSEGRKMAFMVIMLVLLVAIGVLIYSLLNQSQSGASFRRRRRY